jgi:hypothetical protein
LPEPSTARSGEYKRKQAKPDWNQMLDNMSDRQPVIAGNTFPRLMLSMPVNPVRQRSDIPAPD